MEKSNDMVYFGRNNSFHFEDATELEIKEAKAKLDLVRSGKIKLEIIRH